MTDYFSKAPHLHDCKIGPHHDECTCGLAAARAEIERLKAISPPHEYLAKILAQVAAQKARAEKAEAERDQAREYGGQARIRENRAEDARIKAEAERDEALAQVVAALEAAAKTCSLAATNYLGKGADTDLGSRSRAICDVALRIRALKGEVNE